MPLAFEGAGKPYFWPFPRPPQTPDVVVGVAGQRFPSSRLIVFFHIPPFDDILWRASAHF